MKKLLYLAIIVGAGYFLFHKFETEIFNAVPQEVRRKIFSVEIPVEYRGKFISDLKANTDWIRAQPYNTKVKNLLISLTGKLTIDVGARATTYVQDGKVVVDEEELVEKGPGYIVVEYYSEHAKGLSRSRVELDGDGFWIYPEEFQEKLPGFKERFRRIK